MSAVSQPPRVSSIFVYEFITGGGLWSLDHSPAPTGALLREGAAMLAAVVEDFARLNHTDVVILRDARLPRFDGPPVRQITVDSAARERSAFAEACQSTAAAIVIAPEFRGILLERTQWAEHYRSYLLSPGSAFVEIASCKWTCFRLWSAAGVPTIPTFRVSDELSWTHLLDRPVVTKPADGAGSEEIFVWERGQQVPARVRHDANILIQPKLEGYSTSRVLFGNQGKVQSMPGAFQYLDNNFKYRGGSFPLPRGLEERSHCLALQAIRCLPPFRGYVGIDMILGRCPRGTDDVVVEVNPRVTSSIVGLRRFLKDNLAQYWMSVDNRHCAPLEHALGKVEFEIF